MQWKWDASLRKRLNAKFVYTGIGAAKRTLRRVFCRSYILQGLEKIKMQGLEKIKNLLHRKLKFSIIDILYKKGEKCFEKRYFGIA